MALRTSAEEAEDAAAGFSAFRTPLPEHSTEITSYIADLYSISASLTSLEDLSKNERLARNWSRVQSDVALVQSSLKCTVGDIFDHFGRLDGGSVPPEVYKRTWATMNRFFWDEAQYSLTVRFAKYKTFLRELNDMLKDKSPDNAVLLGCRHGIRSLLAIQEDRLEARLARTRLGRQPSSGGNAAERPFTPGESRRRPRSYERSRPPPLSSPQSPLSPSSGGFSDFPPSAPEAPSSPLTGSASATTTLTNASDGHSTTDSIQEHWVKEVFLSYDTETPVPPPDHKAGCFDDYQIEKRTLKQEGFEQLLQLAFNDRSQMTVYFFLRQSDNRTRIVCKVPHRSRPSETFCFPLNLLEVTRSGSSLHLCRRRHAGSELVIWATLNFMTIESLVVFFCTFVALRAQDTAREVTDIRDYDLEDEEELYGGQIIDDGYAHALRVFQDKATGAIRLQASVHNGPKQRTPVWTSFITPHIHRRGWLRQIDSRTILIRKMQTFNFISSEKYCPVKTTRGEHVLKFKYSTDADDFLDIIEDIADATE